MTVDVYIPIPNAGIGSILLVPPSGTDPTLTPSSSTLNLTSSNGSLAITGNSSTSTIDFTIAFPTGAVSVKTADYTVLNSDSGNTLAMNSTSAHKFTLPPSPVVGDQFTFVKLNTGTLTLQASASQFIQDSTSAGTMVNAQTNETWATMTLKLVTSTLWVVIGATGTWTTA